MRKKSNKKRSLALAYLLSIIVLTLIFILSQKFLGLELTGFAIFDFNNSKNNEKNSLDNLNLNNENKENLEQTNLSINTNNQNNNFNNRSNNNGNSNRNNRGGGGSGGGNSGNQNQFRGYRLMNLGHGLSIWSNQNPISLQDSYFNGTIRLSLYKLSTKILDFNMNFQNNIDLQNLFSDANKMNKKSIINIIQTNMFDVDFYIPREDNFTQIRICKNATSLGQIRENCSTQNGIEEELITLLNPELEISEDEQYFVLKNTSLRNAGIAGELDSVQPIININYPQNNLINLNGNIDFGFEAADASKVEYCDLEISGAISERIHNLTNWISYTLNIQRVNAGNHKWNLKCKDKHNNTAISQNRTMTVIPLNNFALFRINLTQQNLSNITNFVLENPLEGKIQFLEGVDLSGGPDINQFVEINDNNITINSENIPELNKSAVLTFYNVSYENPIILRDGQNCTECRIINSNEGFAFTVEHFSSYSVFGATVNASNGSRAISDPAGNTTAYSGNITGLIISGYSSTQSWQGYYGNVSGTIILADSNDNILYNWSLANPEGEVYGSMNNTITWEKMQCFNYTATGQGGAETPGSTNLGGMNLSVLESQFGIASDDVDGVNETFYLQNHDEFYTSSLRFEEDECKSTRVYSNSGPIDRQFEEILLYEPNTGSVVFASLIEEATVIGFNNEDNDFEMLVLENGHNSDVSASTYFFFVELE